MKKHNIHIKNEKELKKVIINIRENDKRTTTTIVFKEENVKTAYNKEAKFSNTQLALLHHLPNRVNVLN